MKEKRLARNRLFFLLTDAEWCAVRGAPEHGHLWELEEISERSTVEWATIESPDGTRIHVARTDVDLGPVLRRMQDLLWLPQNWDNYGARPVRPDCVANALGILVSCLRPSTSLPQVVPTSKGGVQLEWHVGGKDLEIEVNAPDRIQVFFEDDATGAGVGRHLHR
ncbi:MAG: hypothetical protein KatS3mg109_0267 [Pirellulaceae bacterium]|nr:MAG: hypothetical protein KatS3mg109_0267 [Pirellulaceae bacterium]